MRFEDRVGCRFGRLVVLDRAENIGTRVAWVCACDCGNLTIAITSNLTRGHTQSCGCMKKERAGRAQLKHGRSKTPIYGVWCNMRTRCENKNNARYADYGARGTKVCERWLVFDNFYADMGDAPEGMTLDRKDNDGDYSPENCRWATPQEQNSNTRKNTFLTFAGKTQTVSAWAHEKGMRQSRLWLRLAAGWTVDKALTTPVRNMKRKSEWQTARAT